MNKIKKLFYMFPALIIAGCSQSSSIRFDSGQLDEVPKINASSITIKEDLKCTYPVKIAKYDSIFLIQDLNHKCYISIFDSKGNEVDCLVKKGKGHTEISNLSNDFYVDKKKGTVSVFARPDFVEYNIRDFMNNKPDFCHKTNCSDFVQYPIKNARKLADRYLLEGFTSNMRFVVADRDFRSIYVDYPQILPENKNEDIAAVLTYASKVVVSPNQSRWVQTSYIGGVLEIFEYNDGDIKSVKINPIYSPVYIGEKHDVGWDDETTIGFNDVVVTDRYIYTLLNGTKGKNLRSDPPVDPFTNEITIFDWDGNIKQIVSTDCMMMAIDVDEKENVFYAITFNLEHGYDLKKIPFTFSDDVVK